jgi:hypothetical protein
VTTVLTPTTISGGTGLRVTQARVLLSEWTKFRSLRSTVATLLIAVVVMIGLGAMFAAITASQTTGFGPGTTAISTSLTGTFFAQLAVGVLGVLLITGEYSTGRIRSSLTVVPNRLPMLWGKLTVFAGTVFLTMLAAGFASFFVGQALLGEQLGASLSDPGEPVHNSCGFSRDRDDDLAACVSCFDVLQSRRGVRQWVGPVDDGEQGAGVDQFGDGDQVRPVPVGRDHRDLLADEQVDDGRAEDAADRADDVAGGSAPVDDHDPGRGGGAAEIPQAPVSDVVQDDVVANCAIGEVIRRVVDHVRGAERPHHVAVPGAAHAGDLGTECGRDLDGKSPNPSRGAVHQDPLPGLDVTAVPDRM